ncbi:MAG: hypothetical protein HGB37_02870 [Candidatus Moranbacteria bacterium]|nr:hypothetical protein [Candidatus Moranbacteria bacterium]
MEQLSEEESDGVNFVARTAKYFGITGRVRELNEVPPFSPGKLTVAVSGSVLETFLQLQPFYTAYHVMVLSPKRPMSERELVYYSLCIRRNKYRYNYGRQANRTLRSLKIPGEVPKGFLQMKIDEPNVKAYSGKKIKLSDRKWEWFRYADLFDIETGVGPLVKPEDVGNGVTPFISTTSDDNGISYLYYESNPAHKGGCITVSNDGSVGEAFFQDKDFSASYKVNVLSPKFELNTYRAMFLITVIKKEKYRYSYARKWGLDRMRESKMKLPVNVSGKPDWAFMEAYIKSLPYSAEI